MSDKVIKMSLLYIGLGGFLGAVCRYLNGLVWAPLACRYKWIFPTLLGNLLACFLFGLLFPYAERCAWFNAQLRKSVFVGFLGGFSTYSSYMFEAFALLEKGDVGLALLYIFLHFSLGLLCVWLGLQLSLKLL